MKIADIPKFPPDTPQVHIAFGDISLLPDWEELPREYKSGRARGCIIADALFAGGWQWALKAAKTQDGENASINLAQPPSDYRYENEQQDAVRRFQRAIVAIMNSYQPKHEHKIAGVGYLIDLWASPLKTETQPEKKDGQP